MSEVKPELIPLEELVTLAKESLEDSEYIISLKEKNPKTRRRNLARLNYWHSIHHYLNQYDLILNTRAKK